MPTDKTNRKIKSYKNTNRKTDRNNITIRQPCVYATDYFKAHKKINQLRTCVNTSNDWKQIYTHLKAQNVILPLKKNSLLLTPVY